MADDTLSAALECAHCEDPILPGTNYACDPDAHPWCAFRERQRREAASRSQHLPGCLCDDQRCPAPRTPVSDFVRRLRKAFASTGLAGCVLWHPGDTSPCFEGRWARTPEIEHSEFALSASRAFSDLPGQVPGSLIVAQTPCPAEDLGQPDPGPEDMLQFRRQGLYKCRLSHIHYGISPYGRDDIPAGVRHRIRVTMGEENADG